MYSRCIFTYNNTFYNDILNERTKLFLLRDNVLKRNIQIKLISKNYTKKEVYADFVRLSFILGEPFIGRFGYENVIY